MTNCWVLAYDHPMWNDDLTHTMKDCQRVADGPSWFRSDMVQARCTTPGCERRVHATPEKMAERLATQAA